MSILQIVETINRKVDHEIVASRKRHPQSFHPIVQKQYGRP
jgi:hypothetical protein